MNTIIDEAKTITPEAMKKVFEKINSAKIPQQKIVGWVSVKLYNKFKKQFQKEGLKLKK